MSEKDIMIGEGVKFERIRRITGYLVGTLDRFNNAKRAEEADRVSIRLPLAWSASEPQFENKTGGREIFRPLFFIGRM